MTNGRSACVRKLGGSGVTLSTTLVVAGATGFHHCHLGLVQYQIDMLVSLHVFDSGRGVMAIGGLDQVALVQFLLKPSLWVQQ